MHPSSKLNMNKCIDKLNLRSKTKLVMLDVGGRALTPQDDRSYITLFAGMYEKYHIADIVNGPGVTHVMPGPYQLPFEDNSLDLIVSGQTLEHVPNPFRLVAEMKRVLKPKHHMIIIVPSMGRRHDKFDYWRFMDDAFTAIADETKLKIVSNWVDRTVYNDRSDRIQDNVFIGQKP